ncbi:HDOD domain-containing protein [Marinimicrobium sp. ABcell2]|uniref:HDOD domain-containing protein n=1 Tax=Marinimicrobium sp. ABcell2 TaxID=3069751 RepID=UPI0027B08450|nr:HDOD domain-containing protein [Marinimicrobium sp. ABcell2]MDQ2076685.1 HDOD domain-containing protein [Marinimicrobium sp. ABcell2]
MPVPTSVESLLNDQNIRYDIAATPVGADNQPLWHDQHLRNVGAAKSVLLEDSRGRVLAVVGADTLLDLNAVNRQMERELRATGLEDVRQFCDSHSLQSVPALPKLANLPTLVDRRLLDRESLLLDSGDDEQLLHLDRKDFQQVLEDAIICDIAVPLAPLEQDSGAANDSEQILGAVKNFTQLRMQQRLEETLELPPLSETAQRIINLRVDPEADISDLAEIVETDPSLSAQVVSWAASPYYSAPGKIKSIHDAIVRVLGFDMVLNLALGLALGRTLQLPKDGPDGYLNYWQEAVYTAATIEGLVTVIPREERPGFGMAYLAGLLHNFGYLILAEVFPPYFSQYCRLAEANPHVMPQTIERHLLGVTRDQLAGTLMSLWSMPEEISQGLRHQNNPGYQGEHARYAKLVFVAKRLLLQEGVGRGPKLAIPDEIFTELSLDPEKARATVANVIESAAELDHIALQLSPA